MKTTSCNGEYAFNNTVRCGAKSKRNNGAPCRSPAVKGKKRCRIHGGALGSGGQFGNQNALKHGYTTQEAKSFRKAVKAAIKASKQISEIFLK